MRSVDPGQISISDDTPWSRYIEPVPRHVIRFEGAIDFAMSPWWNLDALGERY